MKDNKKTMELEQIIKATYRNYQSFMNVKQLPDFKVIFKKANQSQFLAEVRYAPFLTLFVNHGLIENQSEIFPSILYHEFTHIYDPYILFGDYKDRDEDLLHLYTEYHATQIQTLKDLKLENINSSLNIDSTLNRNLNRYKTMFSNDIMKCVQTFKVEDYNKTKRSLCYYIGVISIYNVLNNPTAVFENPIKSLNPYITPIVEQLLKISYKNIPDVSFLKALREFEIELDEVFTNLSLLNNMNHIS